MNPESVALTRDIVFIVVAILGVACAIVITTLIVLTYWKVAHILNAVRNTTDAVASTATAISRAVGPALTGAGIGVRLARAWGALFGSSEDKQAE